MELLVGGNEFITVLTFGVTTSSLFSITIVLLVCEVLVNAGGPTLLVELSLEMNVNINEAIKYKGKIL